MDAGEQEKEAELKEAVYDHSVTFIRKVGWLATVQTSSSNILTVETIRQN